MKSNMWGHDAPCTCISRALSVCIRMRAMTIWPIAIKGVWPLLYVHGNMECEVVVPFLGILTELWKFHQLPAPPLIDCSMPIPTSFIGKDRPLAPMLEGSRFGLSCTTASRDDVIEVQDPLCRVRATLTQVHI
jgi:hypothetical protein